jgi:hypothetical protein
MTKFAFATVIASGLIAGVLGVTAPAAQAEVVADSVSTLTNGVDHHVWLDQIGPKVNVPQVDTSVHQSR